MMERKFNTLGVSMWSLALHGTFRDASSDLLEDMRDLENLETGPLSPKVTKILQHDSVSFKIFKRSAVSVKLPAGGGWVLAWSMIFVFFLYVLLTNITVMNMLIGIVCEVVSEVKLSDEKNTAVVYLKRNLRNLLIELDEDNNNQHLGTTVIPDSSDGSSVRLAAGRPTPAPYLCFVGCRISKRELHAVPSMHECTHKEGMPRVPTRVSTDHKAVEGRGVHSRCSPP